MATDPDDVRFQGKTGSSRPTTKMTRLTQVGLPVVLAMKEGVMDGNSDYLTLWTHCETRGYDEKNRMISAASVLISLAGTLLVASITTLTAINPGHLGTAAGLG